MKNWYATKRMSLDELNKWLDVLPTKEGNFTKVEETVKCEFASAPGIYEITLRLSGPHLPNKLT